MVFQASASVVALLMLSTLVVLPSTSAAPQFDCSDETVCDAGAACDIAVLQGRSTAGAEIGANGLTHTAVAVAIPTAVERSIFTTCSEVSLTAYTASDSATVEVFYPCATLCAVSASYDVWVEDVGSPEMNAFCATTTWCEDDEELPTSATKTGIGIDVPHTEVTTANCGYATAYEDLDGDGQWSDDPRATDFDCAPTANYIGILA